MATASVRTPGCPWLTPYLVARDVRRTLDFYERAFGFARSGEPLRRKDGTVLHAEMSHRDAVVMIGVEDQPGSPHKPPATTATTPCMWLYLYVEDVDDHYLLARAAGAEVLEPPTDMFYGDRAYRVRDPDGCHWGFATHTGRFTSPPTMD